MMVADHNSVFDVLQKGLETNIGRVERHLAQLQDTTKLLQAKIKRIGDEHVLLTKEIQHIRDLIRVGESNLGKATREASDEPRAMTMLMVSDGLYRNRARLAALEKRDSVGLPNERDQLEQALANNRRAQENDKAQIENYRLQLTNLHRTHLVTPPMQSIRPVSLSRPSVVALFVVVGVMLGIVCAFVVEFLNNARKEMAVRYSERA
jgi:LPS O-antigen subunit length determinant protein (WzzB/FepE family)